MLTLREAGWRIFKLSLQLSCKSEFIPNTFLNVFFFLNAVDPKFVKCMYEHACIKLLWRDQGGFWSFLSVLLSLQRTCRHVCREKKLELFFLKLSSPTTSLGHPSPDTCPEVPFTVYTHGDRSKAYRVIKHFWIQTPLVYKPYATGSAGPWQGPYPSLKVLDPHGWKL